MELERAEKFLKLEEIKIADICNFVSATTKDHGTLGQIRSIHGIDVIVGDHHPPKGGPHIVEALGEIVSNINIDKTYRDSYAFNLHAKYESLHPYTDGNGRSGRLIWLWMMGGFEWLDASPYNFLQYWYYQSLNNWRSK